MGVGGGGHARAREVNKSGYFALEARSLRNISASTRAVHDAIQTAVEYLPPLDPGAVAVIQAGAAGRA